ncbi:hypothetical protein HK102_005297, partial [Quaeritorhiza haematococci]
MEFADGPTSLFHFPASPSPSPSLAPLRLHQSHRPSHHPPPSITSPVPLPLRHKNLFDLSPELLETILINLEDPTSFIVSCQAVYSLSQSPATRMRWIMRRYAGFPALAGSSHGMGDKDRSCIDAYGFLEDSWAYSTGTKFVGYISRPCVRLLSAQGMQGIVRNWLKRWAPSLVAGGGYGLRCGLGAVSGVEEICMETFRRSYQMLLRLCASVGFADTLKVLVEWGLSGVGGAVGFDLPYEFGLALCFAVSQRQESVVDYLTSFPRGAVDVHANHDDAFLYAVRMGSVGILRRLVHALNNHDDGKQHDDGCGDFDKNQRTREWVDAVRRATSVSQEVSHASVSVGPPKTWKKLRRETLSRCIGWALGLLECHPYIRDHRRDMNIEQHQLVDVADCRCGTCSSGGTEGQKEPKTDTPTGEAVKEMLTILIETSGENIQNLDLDEHLRSLDEGKVLSALTFLLGPYKTPISITAPTAAAAYPSSVKMSTSSHFPFATKPQVPQLL